VAKVSPVRMEIVKRSDDTKGLVVLPRRWVVERTFFRFGETLAQLRYSRLIQLAFRRLARAQVVNSKKHRCAIRDEHGPQTGW